MAMLLLPALVLPAWGGPPKANPRVALVVGNARYESSVGALRNASNDAKSVAKALRGLGFAVTEEHNVTRDELLKAVAGFRTKLSGAEVGLFYYAGHGISVTGSNYLIPVKSGYNPEGADETSLRMLAETRLFNAEQVVAEMSAAGGRCNLVILDACRTTPVARNPRSRDLSVPGGLAEMKPPAGSLIAFATDAGRTADDGTAANGLYTEVLLGYLRTPGLTIEQVFKRTRAEVMRRSGGAQIPAEYSRLVGDDIYLAGAAPVEPARPKALKAEPVEILSPQAIQKLATAGKTSECLDALELSAAGRGRGNGAYASLDLLLDQVRDDLKDESRPASAIETSAKTCERLLKLIPACLSADHPQKSQLEAKAYNRRGDCLLRLGRAEQALASYQSAIALVPGDAYPVYNRGRAYLALGRKDEARADFLKVAARDDQPKARKLAQASLAQMEPAAATADP